MKIEFLIFTCLLVFPLLANSSSEADEIIGRWVTQKNEGLIEITESDGRFSGVVLGSVNSNSKVISVDVNNPDPTKQDRNVIGMVTMGGYRFKGGEYIEGWIYDPNNGKTYKSTMRLTEEGKLEVRGYVGIKIFGRTETWQRIE